MSETLPEPIDPETAPKVAPSAPRPLSLRGRAFKALALSPEPPLPEWLAGLDAALKRSPTLLKGRAVILDCAQLKPEPDALETLMRELKARGIAVLGIEGADVVGEGLPPLLVKGQPSEKVEIPSPAEPAPQVVTSITVEGSVRSGQSVINPTGDVTVMGSVSSGAEILAGGSIHVYGALRGRAIAGAARNPRARIYCRKFEPELLGIDRLVRTAEDMGTALRGKAAQVWLDGGNIRMASLD
ncbi:MULTISPECIES: septum site-determining protein MinC [unclassified Methylobacterium]|jgi:septum site-determining protein MinC|uniref:septum site-determining protein MinC n=1 Tax=unclassified Methylobacterium TaxID=2615210 RepID=UPI0013526D60|nr:septum site-determining protein MinC [Methylobacterium sp. 2A]MWV22321.1 septum formation inhibitor MinC [Methylobacterium sp. 2A]